MSRFTQWYEYMVNKGYMSDSLNKIVLEMAFEAGEEQGYYSGMRTFKEWGSTGGPIQKPFWYAPEN